MTNFYDIFEWFVSVLHTGIFVPFIFHTIVVGVQWRYIKNLFQINFCWYLLTLEWRHIYQEHNNCENSLPQQIFIHLTCFKLLDEITHLVFSCQGLMCSLICFILRHDQPFPGYFMLNSFIFIKHCRYW